MGRKIALGVTAFAGTWTFLGLHGVWWAVWIAGGVEPFPFGLLTMILSLEAILLGTLIMMGQNLAADRDRKAAEGDRERARHIEQIALHVAELVEAKRA